MRFAVVTVFFACGFIHSANVEAVPNSFITQNFPWLLRLQSNHPNNSFDFCSAALLRICDNLNQSDVVITASDCVEPCVNHNCILAPQYTINVTDTENGGEVIRVTEISRLHKGWGIDKMPLAMLKLAKPLPLAGDKRGKLIRVANSNSSFNGPIKCEVLGWKDTPSNVDLVQKRLIFATIDKSCGTDDTICAYFGNPRTPDTWEPAMFEDNAGSTLACGAHRGRRLYGIFKGVQDRNALFYRLDKALSWIKERAKTMSDIPNCFPAIE